MRRIDDNFRVLNVNPTHWLHLLSTLPQFIADRGILYLLYQETDIIHAVHSHQGARPDLTGPFSTPAIAAQQLQQREEVDAVIMLESRLASYLLAKMQALFTPEMDIFRYLELGKESLEEERGRRFYIWPPEFWNQGLFNLIQQMRTLLDNLPNDMLGLLVIFEENQIWSSLIFEFLEGRVHRIATLPPLSQIKISISDWQSDYPKLIEYVKEVIGRPSLGFFSDDETFRFLIRSQQPLEFLRQARKAGQIIVDPLPGRIRGQV